MKRLMATAAACTILALAIGGNSTTSNAQDVSTGGHSASKYYKDNASSARSARQRRGGYSFFAEDTINTYGDSRTTNSGANSYRFEFYTRQTPSGPFDHGFFFDSGIGMNGGNSPYLN